MWSVWLDQHVKNGCSAVQDNHRNNGTSISSHLVNRGKKLIKRLVDSKEKKKEKGISNRWERENR